MTGKRFHIVWLVGLALFINSCGGNDANPDAVISPVETDKTTAIAGSTGLIATVDVVHFKVTASSTDTSPVADTNVEIFGSSPGIGDPTAGFVGGALGGALLNPANPNFLATRTDHVGVVTVYYQFTPPACESIAGGFPSPEDIVATATVSASIGGSTGTWLDNITIKKC
jgi:hypothetical protein